MGLFFNKPNYKNQEAKLKNYYVRKKTFTEDITKIIYQARDNCLENPEVAYVDTVKSLLKIVMENQYKLIDIDWEFDFTAFKTALANAKTIEDVLELQDQFEKESSKIRGVIIQKAKQKRNDKNNADINFDLDF